MCEEKKLIGLHHRQTVSPLGRFGDIIPDGYLTTWSPADSWSVLGSWLIGIIPTQFPYFGPDAEPSP